MFLLLIIIIEEKNNQEGDSDQLNQPTSEFFGSPNSCLETLSFVLFVAIAV